MDRDILAHLPVVLAVARRRGFAAAAEELGMSPSAVSHAVRAVEDRLGLPLFTRTTRSVSLTDWGAHFVQAATPSLREISDAVERVRAARGQIVGLLRLNVPRVALPLAITPVLREMTRRYPDLTVEVFADDAITDIVAGGFDAGVRLGGMIAQDMVAVRLTPPFRSIIVAAPSYLEEHGVPEAIGDLKQHNCITYRMVRSGSIYDWELQDGPDEVSVEAKGTALVNDSLYAVQLALDGVGLVYLFEPLVAEALKDGRLIEVLPSTVIEEPGLFLYFPQRASQAPKLRAFIDTARAVLSL